MPIIEVEDLSFRYRGSKVPALQHISFSAKEGELIGVIGPTGAGKTTLCMSLTGVIPHTVLGKMEGTVRVKGLSTRDHEVVELTSVVGLVLQDAQAQLLMTDVEKEIVFPLENIALSHEEMHRRLNNVLDLVHLKELRYLHPFYLSGGQRQRVALASILAMEPEILVLDEATSELDPIGVEEVLNVVSELKASGKTVILVEHNMEELVRFADRIIVLNRGEMIAEGTTQEVLTNLDLLREIGVYPSQITSMAARLRDRGLPIEELPLTLDEGVATLERLMEARAAR